MNLRSFLLVIFSILFGIAQGFRGGNGRPLFSVSSMDLADFSQYANSDSPSFNYGRPLQTRFGRSGRLL
ncbi:unnamed protein product, partial [Mesorhabditis belari]